MRNYKIGLALLASGSSMRFGKNKLLAEFHGNPMAASVMTAIPKELKSDTCVITCWDEVASLAEKHNLHSIYNSSHLEGISASIRLAVKHFSKYDSLMFLTCDQPLLEESSILSVAKAWVESPNCICCAACGGKRRSPCIFPSIYFKELSELSGDTGGSRVIQNHPTSIKLVEIEEKQLIDCDTQEELNKISEI